MFQTTVGWLGCPWLRWLAEWARASLVEGSHTKLVLMSLVQVPDSQCGLSDRLLGHPRPAGRGLVLALQDVAGDWAAAVIRGWLPGHCHLVTVDITDCGLVRCTRFV